jgi:hypothetical protein
VQALTQMLGGDGGLMAMIQKDPKMLKMMEGEQ